jgi:hypothetical protein
MEARRRWCTGISRALWTCLVVFSVAMASGPRGHGHTHGHVHGNVGREAAFLAPKAWLSGSPLSCLSDGFRRICLSGSTEVRQSFLSKRRVGLRSAVAKGGGTTTKGRNVALKPGQVRVDELLVRRGLADNVNHAMALIRKSP